MQSINGFWNHVSFSWKKGLPKSQQNYAWDESQGQDVTLFVVDSGANVAGPITNVSFTIPLPIRSFFDANGNFVSLTSMCDFQARTEKPAIICRSE